MPAPTTIRLGRAAGLDGQTSTMATNEHIEKARTALGGDDKVWSAYDDDPVFPDHERIETGPDHVRFPGWPGGAVLVLAHENQGIVTWGIDLETGEVIVGGDLADGCGTQRYAPDIETFVRTRRWDHDCLQEPLVQAQADAIEPHDLAVLRSTWIEGPTTFGWPTRQVVRFEQGRMKLMVWADDEQADWYLTGPVDELAVVLPTLRPLSNLADALWSNDDRGAALLA